MKDKGNGSPVGKVGKDFFLIFLYLEKAINCLRQKSQCIMKFNSYVGINYVIIITERPREEK